MVVVDNRGETPGKPGFKMAVAADGTLCGTIGGGMMEHDLVEECRATLRQGNTQPVVRRKVHRVDAEADGSGMLCGGTQMILLHVVSGGDRNAIEDAALAARGECAGRLRISPLGIMFERDERQTPSPVFQQSAESDWAYADKIMTGSFAEFGTHVPDGAGSYVVIMTAAHGADELVLRQVAGRPLRYVGMLASKTKRARILESLRRDGFDEAVLASIHTPIGLPMQSHTAAEIAISIAAELINTRNSQAFKPL